MIIIEEENDNCCEVIRLYKYINPTTPRLSDFYNLPICVNETMKKSL